MAACFFFLLADWSWLEPAVEQQRRKSPVRFLGVNEQVERTEAYWHPFWLSDLSYSQSEGTVFKSGTSKRGFLLLDATSTQQGLASAVEEGSTLFAQLESAARRELVEGRLTLPALVSEAAAQQVLDAYARANPSFGNPQVKIRRLVYLPAAQVVYPSKQGARTLAVSLASAFNGETGSLRQATASFSKRYVS